MTPINSPLRNLHPELSTNRDLHPPRSESNGGLSAGTGSGAVAFVAQHHVSQVNFGGPQNLAQSPRNEASEASISNDPLVQLVTLIQDMLQRLQALIQGGAGGANEHPEHAARGAGGSSPVVASHDRKAAAQEIHQSNQSAKGSPGAGDFTEHSLGNQLSVQKSAEDRIGMAKDPERGDVIKVDFKKGHYTEHSTSPRAEIKDSTPLQEGQPYSFKFGMKREANNDGTFFQVLDHNNAKPSPRAWLATKDGQYQLHLKTSEDSNAPSKVFNIGKPGDATNDVGKWADFQIDFKRGIGNGEISVTKNCENVFDKKGISTMFNSHSSDSYAKFGQYRNEGDHKPATSLFSGFSVAKV